MTGTLIRDAATQIGARTIEGRITEKTTEGMAATEATEGMAAGVGVAMTWTIERDAVTQIASHRRLL